MNERVFVGVVVERQNPVSGVVEELHIDYQPLHHDGSWGQTQEKYPGGMVEPGEEPIDAACRELFQETGIVVGKNGLRHLKLFGTFRRRGVTQLFYRIERGRTGGKLKTGVYEDNGSRIVDKRWVAREHRSRKMFYSHHEAYKVLVAAR